MHKVYAEDLMLMILLLAIDGTVGILKAVKNNAPAVKRVVVTSSGAAVMDFTQPKTYTYTEVTTLMRSEKLISSHADPDQGGLEQYDVGRGCF